MITSNRAAGTDHKTSSFHFMLMFIQCIAWLPRATPQATASPAKFSYVYVGTATSWTAAEADCVSRGGHLASIATAADNQQVQTLCSQKLPYAQLKSPANSGCWIGLNDQVTEATYVWTDGTPFSYTAWHQGPTLPQPGDNKHTKYAEDCVLLVVDSIFLGWHDWGCTDQQSYVCKVPIPQSPSPSPAVNITQPSPSVPSPSPAPVVVAPRGSALAANGSSSSSSSSSTPGTAAIGSTSPPSTTSTGTSSSAATSPSAAGGSVTTAGNTATPAQSMTGTVPSMNSSATIPTFSASSLTGAATTASSNNQTATAGSTSSGGDNSDKWKLVVSIIIPVLTGAAALITITYTGWKWWHKRQATLARRRGTGLTPHASAVKPLIAV